MYVYIRYIRTVTGQTQLHKSTASCATLSHNQLHAHVHINTIFDGKKLHIFSQLYALRAAVKRMRPVTAVVHKLFRPRARNRILKTLRGHTTVKIKIVLHIEQGQHCIKTHRRTITSFKSKFLKNVHTVKVTVTVIPQLGNERCAIFFSYVKLSCWTLQATW